MNKQATRLIASLCLVAFLQPSLAQEAATPPNSWSSTCGRRKKRKARPLAARRQVQQGCVPHRRRGVGSAQGRRAQGGSRAAAGLAGDGKTLTVLNWSIYYNKQTQSGGRHARERRHPGLLDPRQEERRRSPAASARGRNRPAAGTRAARSRRIDLAAHLGIRRNLRRQARTTCASFILRAGKSKESSRAMPDDTEALLEDRAQDRRGGGHGDRPIARPG